MTHEPRYGLGQDSSYFLATPVATLRRHQDDPMVMDQETSFRY